MPQLADFERAASLGFESGKASAPTNPLGQFVKGMLQAQQQKQQVETEFGMKKALQEQEYMLKSQYPDPLTAIMLKQLGLGENEKGENIIYRDLTGKEIPKEIAQSNIEKGNTDYYTFRKDITKSGLKETIISKPEDLQKIQQQKGKSDFILTQAQDALNTISEIEKGVGHFGLFGQLPSIPGTERYTWETNINKLLSGKMIDLMTQMKEASKTGATGFGQLSEKEGQILREASTALKRGLAPEKAQEYLNNMKAALQKVMQGGQQPQGQEDMSQMSDEELRRIATGE